MERTSSHIKSLCLSFSSSDPVIPASSCAMYISLPLSAGCKQIYTAQYCQHSRRDIEPTVHCCNSQKKYHKRNALFEMNLSQCSLPSACPTCPLCGAQRGVAHLFCVKGELKVLLWCCCAPHRRHVLPFLLFFYSFCFLQ